VRAWPVPWASDGRGENMMASLMGLITYGSK